VVNNADDSGSSSANRKTPTLIVTSATSHHDPNTVSFFHVDTNHNRDSQREKEEADEQFHKDDAHEGENTGVSEGVDVDREKRPPIEET
jgi:hypothetical protein